MPIENNDKGLESQSDKGASRTAEGASREADAGKGDLVQKQFQQMKDIKDGVVRSGVSGLLGKPKFFDSQLGEAGKKLAETFNTGETSRRAINELRALAGLGSKISEKLHQAGIGEDPRKLGDLGGDPRRLGDLGGANQHGHGNESPSSKGDDPRRLGDVQAGGHNPGRLNEKTGQISHNESPQRLGDVGANNPAQRASEKTPQVEAGPNQKTSDANGSRMGQRQAELQRSSEQPNGESQLGNLRSDGAADQKFKQVSSSSGERGILNKSVSGIFGKPVFFDSQEENKGKGTDYQNSADSKPAEKNEEKKGVLDELSEAKDKLVKKVEAFTKPISADMIVNRAGADTSGGKDKAEATDSEVQKIKDAKVPLSPEQEKQLNADMAEINKLPEEQRKKVLESIDKIASAETGDTTKLDPAKRAELISSMTHQIAHPESIKQGAKDTCVSANVEKTLAMTHPDQYADMVAQLSTKGEYTTPDGKTTVKAQREADGRLADLSDPTKQRSATSELMQTAITNLGMPEGETYKSYQPGREPIPSGVIKAEDSGERVVGADGKEKKFEGLSRTAKEDILNKLDPGDGYQARKIQTPDDLGQAWKDNGGKAPLNVTVRINAEHTGMGSAKDGSAGTHAVTITHMEFGPDGKPTQIYYENTADSTDHSYPNGKPVPADEFVRSMQGERSNEYKDGSVDRWPEPMTATVRTDGDKGRESKVDEAKNRDLDKAVEDFRDSTHKDAFIDYGTDRDKMRHSLEGRPRWEVEEINRRYKEKYGKSLDEEIVDELDGRERIQYRQMLKGTDTQSSAPPPKR